MPYYEKFYYPEDSLYKTGDTIYWKGLTLKVGNDGEELNKWGSERTHIVTTCGRVIPLSELPSKKDKDKDFWV